MPPVRVPAVPPFELPPVPPPEPSPAVPPVPILPPVSPAPPVCPPVPLVPPDWLPPVLAFPPSPLPLAPPAEAPPEPAFGARVGWQAKVKHTATARSVPARALNLTGKEDAIVKGDLCCKGGDDGATSLYTKVRRLVCAIRGEWLVGALRVARGAARCPWRPDRGHQWRRTASIGLGVSRYRAALDTAMGFPPVMVVGGSEHLSSAAAVSVFVRPGACSAQVSASA